MPDDDKRVSLTGAEINQIVETLGLVKAKVAAVDVPMFIGVGKPSDALDGVIALLQGKLDAAGRKVA